MGIKIILGLLIGFYFLGALLLTVFQREMLYMKTPEYQSGLKELSIENDDETLKILELNPGRDRAIIYFGGNAEPVVFNEKPFSDTFPDYTVYLVNYRGYGGSTGVPSEQNLFADSLAIYDKVSSNHTSTSIIGRSLGSGVASYLASQKTIESLVLITPYDSIQAIAQGRFPVYPISMLLRDKYDSVSRAANISTKVLIIAAELDKIIPLKHTYNLRNAFRKEQVSMTIIEEANHNNLSAKPEYYQALTLFLGN